MHFSDQVSPLLLRISLSATLLPLTFLFPLANFSWAEMLTSFSEGGLQISLEESSGNNYILSVQSSLEGNTKASAFTLDSPPRLVMDLSGIATKNSRKVALTAPHVQALRTAGHADKTRFVIDLKAENLPTYNVSVSEDHHQITLQFGFDGSAPPPVPKDTPQIAKIKPPKTAAADESVGITDDIEIAQTTKTLGDIEKKSAKTSTGTASVEENTNTSSNLDTLSKLTSENDPVQPAGLAVIDGIFYKALFGSTASALMIKVNSLTNYRLARKRPDLYELTLEKARLAGAHLGLAQFPPDNFKGFFVVLAKQEASDVIVQIYVEEDVVLAPFRAQGQLWVKIQE